MNNISDSQTRAVGEFTAYDSLGLAELVRSKQLKPEELLQIVIDRVETVEPALNAVCTKMYEAGEKAIAAGLPEGPFKGVPYMLKDTHASYAGYPFTNGAKLLAGNIPSHDSTLVKRYKEAGLVIIGKTNMCEFGLVPTTEPVLFGATHNPWNTDYSPGGSSGGAAAVVASRMMPACHAGDGGGSIRVPSSCCGVFGLKPSRGRVPLGPDAGEITEGLVTSHAVSISVRDNAALLDVISGPDIGDPYGIPDPARPYLEEVGADPGKLKIALFTGFGTAPEHPDCIDAANDVAGLCESLGHTVEIASPEIDFDQYNEAILMYFHGHVAATLDRISALSGRKVTADMVEPLTWSIAEKGWQKSAAEFAGVKALENAITRKLGNFFTRYDVILSPTLAELPPKLGEIDTVNDASDDLVERLLNFTRYTAIQNLTGTPAMSVPLSWNVNGLPVGTQFAASYGSEALLFRLAGQLEQARPWRDRIPGIVS